MNISDQAKEAKGFVKDCGRVDMQRVAALPPDSVRAALDGFEPVRFLNREPTGWLWKEVRTEQGSPTQQMLVISPWDGQSFIFATAAHAQCFAIDHPPSIDWDAMGRVMREHDIPGDIAPLESESEMVMRLAREYPEVFPIGAHAVSDASAKKSPMQASRPR